jgi:hypothetical protein
MEMMEKRAFSGLSLCFIQARLVKKAVPRVPIKCLENAFSVLSIPFDFRR